MILIHFFIHFSHLILLSFFQILTISQHYNNKSFFKILTLALFSNLVFFFWIFYVIQFFIYLFQFLFYTFRFCIFFVFLHVLFIRNTHTIIFLFFHFWRGRILLMLKKRWWKNQLIWVEILDFAAYIVRKKQRFFYNSSLIAIFMGENIRSTKWI